MRKIVILLLSMTFAGASHAQADPLDAAINAEHRETQNIARDVYRHPKETLSLFEIKPDLQVLEILPGAGWYTEILAPYLKDNGRLVVASFGADHPNEYLRNIHIDMIKKFDSQPEIYGKVAVKLFQDQDVYLRDFKDQEFDMVVTFRNTHNWIRFGGVEDIYRAFYRVLKPGGILGVVQHRAEAGRDVKEAAEKGYVPESYLIRLVEDVGFELTGKSEVNANPKDTKDHPEGVWTLPPGYRLGEKDKAKYSAIGESDRMTLRFVKL